VSRRRSHRAGCAVLGSRIIIGARWAMPGEAMQLASTR
jgi:hypothetical protein